MVELAVAGFEAVDLEVADFEVVDFEVDLLVSVWEDIDRVARLLGELGQLE